MEFGGMASPTSAASAHPEWIPARLWRLLVKLVPCFVQQKLAKSNLSLFRESTALMVLFFLRALSALLVLLILQTWTKTASEGPIDHLSAEAIFVLACCQL